MKKLISFIAVIAVIASLFVSCASDRYRLTVSDPENLLYEQPRKSYRAGDRVTIKMYILTDVDVECVINGESIGKQTAVKAGDEYTHWEFYFEMPNEDATLTYKISDGFGVLDIYESFSIEGGYNYSEKFRNSALNAELLDEKDEVHLAIFKFETKSEYYKFIADYAVIFSTNNLPNLDELYFESHTLLLMYMPANSGSYRFGVKEYAVNGGEICVYVEQTNNPEIGTDDMAGWFVGLCLDKYITENLTAFDAVFSE